MTRGGKRDGAGRPTGTGQFGEKTKPVRIPESKISAVKAFLAEEEASHVEKVPFYTSRVQAGMPTFADDNVETCLNLHNHLVKRPSETFLAQATGMSMKDCGIYDGDMLIVDRSIQERHGHVVIAAVDGDLTVKRLDTVGGHMRLMPENKEYAPIEITSDVDCHILGVVTNVVHEL